MVRITTSLCSSVADQEGDQVERAHVGELLVDVRLGQELVEVVGAW